MLCFCCCALEAQVVDSSKSKIKYPFAEYCLEKDFSPNGSLHTPVDTSMDGVQRYFPNNFPFQLGLANRKLIFQSDPEIGFRTGFDPLDLFGYNKEEMRYYHTRTPFTEVFPMFGGKKEQQVKLFHTQNITQQWNIALNMMRIRSEGFYHGQVCTDNNISASTNYLSKNKRYSLLANGFACSVKADENGGIRNDSSFENNLFADKMLLPVNLLNTRSKRLHRGVYVKQSLHFGKSRHGEDPSSGGKENIMKGDSVVSSFIHPTHSLSYSFYAVEDMFAYTETTPDTNYYENTFFSKKKTLDSTHLSTFEHAVSWKSTFLQKITAEISFSQKAMRIAQTKRDSFLATDSLMKDEIIHFELRKRMDSYHATGFYWNVNYNYITSGSNKGDYSMNLGLIASLKNDKKIFFELLNDYRCVPFIYSNYTSNHFWWRNTFDKISDLRGKLYYFDPMHKFSFGAEMDQVNGYVYFDSTFTPRQFDSTINIYSAFIQKNFRLGHFHFNTKVVWQNTKSDVIHLPQFVTNHSLYYQGRWFRKVTDIQLGIDIAYCTSYYGDAYMPALGQYYLQDKKMIGNYPFIDFFFNMKVRHAVFLIKFDHANAGFSGSNYYLAPHMPGPDMTFNFGFRWMFFD